MQLSILLFLLSTTAGDHTKDAAGKTQKRSLLLGWLAHNLERQKWSGPPKKESIAESGGGTKLGLGAESTFNFEGELHQHQGEELGGLGHHGLEIESGQIKCPIFQRKWSSGRKPAKLLNLLVPLEPKEEKHEKTITIVKEVPEPYPVETEVKVPVYKEVKVPTST